MVLEGPGQDLGRPLAGAWTRAAAGLASTMLAWKLRQDRRVTVLERTNARNLAAGMVPPLAMALATVVNRVRKGMQEARNAA